MPMPNIFVARETRPGETRVAAIPDTVRAYIRKGFDVQVEAGAGTGSLIDDKAYDRAGATIIDDVAAATRQADVLLRLHPPTLDDVHQMQEGALLVSFIWPFSDKPLCEHLMARKVTTFAMDQIPRTTKAQYMDALSSQMSLAGYKAVLMAAERLPKVVPLMMTAAGTINPAKVVVMGAGVAGLQAIGTAKRLGAAVEATDVRPEVKEQVQSLGAKFIEPPGAASGAGGYAAEQSEDFLRRQQDTVRKHLLAADIVITTARIPGKKAPILVAVSMSLLTWTTWAGQRFLGLAGAGDGTTTAELVGLGATVAAPTHDQAITVVLSILVGGVTLTGSLIAWAKLKGIMKGGQIFLPGHQIINLILLLGVIVLGVLAFFVVPLTGETPLYILLGAAVLASLVLGVTFAIPIGGADMPVLVSLLNSFSGIAAAMTGFVLYNNLLIISGSLVGAAGMILTVIMCRGMNRSLANVLFARFSVTGGGGEYVNVKKGAPVDAAIAMSNASSVIIVPGYGLAAAQAQHAVREMAELLFERGVSVRFAIHEVAGRMPGHMNVLLAEAQVPYEQLFKREDIEADFRNTDVVIVVGANDVVNPAALHDETCPLYGMPILPVHHARQVFVNKRSLASGFAGIKNELFEADNSLMVLGNAKDVVQQITEELRGL